MACIGTTITLKATTPAIDVRTLGRYKLSRHVVEVIGDSKKLEASDMSSIARLMPQLRRMNALFHVPLLAGGASSSRFKLPRCLRELRITTTSDLKVPLETPMQFDVRSALADIFCRFATCKEENKNEEKEEVCLLAKGKTMSRANFVAYIRATLVGHQHREDDSIELSVADARIDDIFNDFGNENQSRMDVDGFCAFYQLAFVCGAWDDLEVHGYFPIDNLLNSIGRLQALESLRIDSSRIFAVDVRYTMLAYLPCLRSLILRDTRSSVYSSNRLTDGQVADLRALTQLETVILGCAEQADNLERLLEAPHSLQWREFHSYIEENKDCGWGVVHEEGKGELAAAKTGAKVTFLVSRLPTLTTLSVRGASNLPSLEHLAHLSSITLESLRGPDSSMFIMAALHGATRVTRLTLDRVTLDDTRIGQIVSRMPHLQRLKLVRIDNLTSFSFLLHPTLALSLQEFHVDLLLPTIQTVLELRSRLQSLRSLRTHTIK